MLPDRVSNPGPLTYESGALPIALRGPADPVLRLNARSAQPMSGPVFSSNSGYVKPSLDQVLG